jgi:hypothetical protein
VELVAHPDSVVFVALDGDERSEASSIAALAARHGSA